MIAAFLNPGAVLHSPEMYLALHSLDSTSQASTAMTCIWDFLVFPCVMNFFFLLKVTDITFWEAEALYI